VKGEQLKVIPG